MVIALRFINLKRVLCFLLMITIMMFTFYIQTMEVYAVFPLVIPLIGAGLVAAVALLVMAGLSFQSDYQAQGAANLWYMEQKKSSTQVAVDALNSFVDFYNQTSDIKIVDDALWSNVRTWVNAKYNPEYNNLGSNVFVLTTTTGYDYYYQTNFNGATYAYMPFNGQEIQWTATDRYELYISNVYGTYKYWKVKMNGVDMAGVSGQNCANDFPPYFTICADTNNQLNLCAQFRSPPVSLNETLWLIPNVPKITTQTSKVLADKLVTNNIAATGSADAVDVPTFEYTKAGETARQVAIPATTTVNDLLGKTYADLLENSYPVQPFTNTWEGTFRECVPTGAYTFVGTGTATIGYDVEGTWDGVWTTNVETGARIWTGTYTDASDATWTGTITGEVADDRTWMDGLLAGFVGTLADIKAAIEAANLAVTGAITAGITSVVDTIVSATEAEAATDVAAEAAIQEYNLPDLFLISMKVIFATVRMVIRAITFIALFALIPANSDNIPENTVLGLDFYKDMQIPNINLSVWELFTILIIFFFGLFIYKQATKGVSRK